MPNNDGMEPMLEMYIYETSQLVDQLEQLAMDSEAAGNLESAIPEIFRIMHTIKGNSMMMMFDGIANLAHATEDLFDYLRQSDDLQPDYERITDLVLDGLDFMKKSVQLLEQGEALPVEPRELIDELNETLESLKFMQEDTSRETDAKQKESKETARYYIAPVKGEETEMGNKAPDIYEVRIHFEAGSEMENIRAFSVVHSLKDFGTDILHLPQDIVESENSKDFIVQNGFMMLFKTMSPREAVEDFFSSVAFVDQLEITEVAPDDYTAIVAMYTDQVQVNGDSEADQLVKEAETEAAPEAGLAVGEKSGEDKTRTDSQDLTKVDQKTKTLETTTKQNFISVGISRVDKLMDLVGELVVSESMVTRNPDLAGLELENFDKAVRQHRMIINELQDVVMSIRMMPLSLTFQKMNRLVRGMKKKVGKEVDLEIIGQETEVDKNVIERIGDPLMHIMRNSIDHGIESADERLEKGKPERGKLTLEAKHSGGDVWITVRDDGRGLDMDNILDKAERKNLMVKPREDYSRKEAYGFLFESGFSTKEQVTEFSGRGVGLDVVARNVEELGGTIVVDSEVGAGTEFAIRIPLTLAIIDGMLMSVGNSMFTLPITAIKESFDAKDQDIIVDPNGNEMCMIRGTCYPIIRLHEKFTVPTEVDQIRDGILIMTEYDGRVALLFADQILGEQQVVVKNLSQFLNKVHGVSGCALLGDGRISLILDPSGLVE